jgi:hypothetical protein
LGARVAISFSSGQLRRHMRVTPDSERWLDARALRDAQLNAPDKAMKTITYAAALLILAATAACEDQPNKGAASPNTGAQQGTNTAAPPPGGVSPAEIRQLRENVLTNQR